MEMSGGKGRSASRRCAPRAEPQSSGLKNRATRRHEAELTAALSGSTAKGCGARAVPTCLELPMEQLLQEGFGARGCAVRGLCHPCCGMGWGRREKGSLWGSVWQAEASQSHALLWVTALCPPLAPKRVACGDAMGTMLLVCPSHQDTDDVPTFKAHSGFCNRRI